MILIGLDIDNDMEGEGGVIWGHNKMFGGWLGRLIKASILGSVRVDREGGAM